MAANSPGRDGGEREGGSSQLPPPQAAAAPGTSTLTPLPRRQENKRIITFTQPQSAPDAAMVAACTAATGGAWPTRRQWSRRAE